MEDDHARPGPAGPGNLALLFKTVTGLSVADAATVVFKEALRQRRGDADKAQDLAQSTWERIVRLLRTQESLVVEYPNAWLRQTVRNVAIDEYRRDTARRRVPGERLDSLDQTGAEPVSTQPGPDEVVAGRDEKERLHEAIAALPGPQREVVLLIMRGMTFSEAACELDIPIGTAKTRFRAAAKNLRGHTGLDAQ